MLSSKDIANIILHIVIIASFIIVFFFTYGSYLEEKIVKQQMEYIVDDLVGDIKVIAPEATSLIKQNLVKPDVNMEEEDKKAAEHNSALKRNSFIALAIVIAIGFGIVYYIHKNYDIPMREIIFSNVISLVAVGITYFLFSTFFIGNYRSADPNFVKKKLLESIQNK